MELGRSSYVGLPPLEQKLFQAVKEHDIEETEELLLMGVDVNSRDRRRETPLFVAVENGDMTIIRILLRHPYIDINVHNIYGTTPLAIAVNLKRLKLVRMLLRAGGRVNDVQSSGQTLLHDAVFLPHLQMVKLLVHYGAEVNVCDAFGRTPLEIAVLLRPCQKIAAYLLRHGADVNLVNNLGLTILLEACLSARTAKDNATIRMLINNGANVNYKDPFSGRTALHMAVINGNMSLVKMLLKNGANPAESCHGISPPKLASIHGYTILSKYLQRRIKRMQSESIEYK